MFKKKLIHIGNFSVVSIILGIMLSVSFVKADSWIESNYDNTQSYTVEKVSTHAQEPTEGELEEYEFYIKGMSSADCEVKVTDALLKCAGVKSVLTSHEDGYTVIEADNSELNSEEIISAVAKAGYEIVEEE